MPKMIIFGLALLLAAGCTLNINTELEQLPVSGEPEESSEPAGNGEKPPGEPEPEKPAPTEPDTTVSTQPHEGTGQAASTPPRMAEPQPEDFGPVDDLHDFVAVDAEAMLLTVRAEAESYPLAETTRIRATVTNHSPGGAYLNSSNYYIDHFRDNTWARLPVNELWTEEGPLSLREGEEVAQIYHLYTHEYTYEPGLYRIALLYAAGHREAYAEFWLQ